MRKFTAVIGIVIISFAFMQCIQRQSSKSSSSSAALPYAMIIPNEDFSGIEPYIQNDKIYISFGLGGNTIEMLLGNEDNTNVKLQSPNERYFNNVIPCPTICGVNDPS
jgi:hypothetical protein